MVELWGLLIWDFLYTKKNQTEVNNIVMKLGLEFYPSIIKTAELIYLIKKQTILEPALNWYPIIPESSNGSLEFGSPSFGDIPLKFVNSVMKPSFEFLKTFKNLKWKVCNSLQAMETNKKHVDII